MSIPVAIFAVVVTRPDQKSKPPNSKPPSYLELAQALECGYVDMEQLRWRMISRRQLGKDLPNHLRWAALLHHSHIPHHNRSLRSLRIHIHDCKGCQDE
jgi:hypothetical protein